MLEALSIPDWSKTRATIETHRNTVHSCDGGFVAHNLRQAWTTTFDGRGFETTPDDGGWAWGMELVSYGCGEARQFVSSPRCTNAQGSRVEYEWDEVVTEWYVNDARGLEHGYTIRNRPHAGTSEASVDPLRIELLVRGDLRPEISVNGRDIAFVSDDGASVVHYNNLVVFDATGATIPARFMDSVSQGPNQSLRAFHIVIEDSNAVYPLTVDPIAQEAYLKASNAAMNNAFGSSVAVSGDTAVIGAPWKDGQRGAAYVFERDGMNSWLQRGYLTAPSPAASDQFGLSVAVSGDTVVVGAYGVDPTTTGAAFVFVRDGMGVWNQQAVLTASNPGEFDEFGKSVSVSGDTVVVGAPIEQSNATGVDGNQVDNSFFLGAGAAYVFVRDGMGNWSQQAYLKASNTNEQDQFGRSVAISGDTVLVSAIGEDSNATGVNGDQANNSAGFSGAAYVFVRDGMGNWNQQAYLKASNTGAGDVFGASVAISGDSVVVGANGEASSATGVNGDQTNNSAMLSGAAYVFVRDGMGDWTQQAYLKASNTGAADSFGTSVAISDNMVVVGAQEEDSSATGVDGDQSDEAAIASGAAYSFARDGMGNWSQQSYLKASNTDVDDRFGISVAVWNGTVMVGARSESSSATGVNGDQANNAAMNAGAVYSFIMSEDSDGDGVLDAFDVCPNSAAGLPIAPDGRPLFDCNGDCLYDATDIQCLVDALLTQ
ncbi:MAG: hypothetical protein H6819_08245 [Phycisphaerales bacterium]|nr:hypothetical protein [Phycisphaerales bacterium]MCB9854205.1 hypothetical protein [Phycisphaerales bacterium]MCB9864282.1 hypothetical protein [Phycisphaerales bacterium]